MHKQRNRTMIKAFRLFLIAALLAAALGILPVPVAYAATRYVSTTGEDSGDCTTSACRTIVYVIGQASSGDTINVAAGTYYENVTINKSLTVTGAGETSTIVDGGGSNRVVLIGNTDSSVTVTISEVKIQNGGNVTWGGGINNYATLTLDNCTISGNSADSGSGIFNWVGGTVELTNSIVSDNSGGSFGGGISNYRGTAKLISSTVSGNSATTGGGIYNYEGTVELTNSTVSGNSAPSAGGGISNGGVSNEGTAELTNSTVSDNEAGEHGGGISISGTGTVTLTNSTVSGNSATNGGGICNRGNGTAELTNSTVSDNSATNGGGIYIDATGTVTLTNNIVAVQASGADCSGTVAVTSLGHNLDSDGTCNLTATGDISNTNPLLGPLQLNAPGNTETHALLPGSPAIDQIPSGTNGCGTTYTTDQRGETRPVNYSGTGCDIGAFELQSDETASSTLQQSVEHTFGATLVKMTLNSGDPGTVSVTKYNQPPGGGSPDENEMPIQWNITASSTYNLDLTLCYTDWELSQGNNVTESTLKMYCWSGGSWDDMGGTVDQVNNCVTKSGVTSLSSWPLGDGPPSGGPTAVTLARFTASPARGGNGFVLPLALVVLGAVGLFVLRGRRRR